MSAAHTPAPWTIIPAREYDGDDDELDGSFTCPASIEGANGDPVCMFGDPFGSATLYENEADYHLIAAAPELLAALEAVELARHTDAPADWQRATDLSDAAIAKALGRTPNEIGDEG